MASSIYNAFHSPPSSPSTEKTTSNNKHLPGQHSPLTPITPSVAVPRTSTKRSAPSPSSSISQYERPTRKQRIETPADNKGNKLESYKGSLCSCSSSSPSSVPLDCDLIGNMEEMVKMLKRVSGEKGLVSDPVLACLVAAQTVAMACTAELIAKRRSFSSSINRAANHQAVEKKMKNFESKKFN